MSHDTVLHLYLDCGTRSGSLRGHMRLRPLRNLVHVERILEVGHTRDAQGEERTAGGIIVPGDYKAIGSRKAVNRADQFRARVLAVGPDCKEPLLVPGVETLIYTWADDDVLDGSRRGMYTGTDAPEGTLFVRWPNDFAGIVYDHSVPPQVHDMSA